MQNAINAPENVRDKQHPCTMSVTAPALKGLSKLALGLTVDAVSLLHDQLHKEVNCNADPLHEEYVKAGRFATRLQNQVRI